MTNIGAGACQLSFIGGLIYLESYPKLRIDTIDRDLGKFVLGDSLQQKDTIGILSRCKNERLNIFEKMTMHRPALPPSPLVSSHFDGPRKQHYNGISFRFKVRRYNAIST